ncbi:MAG: HlyD family efflux transporter periplasmic adaptor subunit [Alphaproteobacteria bacterium]|nr:HlyD family efflux transporter periplasmic adaptor subunit [Alphaproteobacteria bacterium]
MKRVRLIALVLIAATAIASRGVWQPWIDARLAVLGFGPPSPVYLGYVEGETTLVAAPVAGRLTVRGVERGDSVRAGTTLFIVDTAQADAEIRRTEAAVHEAEARLANLLSGRRAAEQDVIRAQRKEVEAGLALAETELAREIALAARGAATTARLDQARAAAAQLRARSESLAAQERVGELGGRDQEIAMADAQVMQMQATLAQARARRDDLMPRAPQDALVENTFFNVGEHVPAGAPVVSLLAPDRVKLRFFVPEAHLALVAPGRSVRFACDSCPATLRATISYVSPRPEFTPPVIYSESARSKLVFLVEARLAADVAALRPGLPVRVEPLDRAAP